MGQLSNGKYIIDDDERRRFEEDGFVHLAGVLSEAEVAEIEITYDRVREVVGVDGETRHDDHEPSGSR